MPCVTRIFLTLSVLSFQSLALSDEFKEFCDKPNSDVEKVAQFSNNFVAEEDKLIQEELFEELDKYDKMAVPEKYYQMVSKPLQSHCNILKNFGGQWNKRCGFLDGEKMVCMDGLYRAIKNKSCLIYSFGLSKDWDFEIAMARLGCIVRAFDPTHSVKIPEEAHKYSNLHHYKVGIKDYNGQAELYIPKTGKNVEFKVKTLETLIKENGDEDKSITYLKLDVEGSELLCFNTWLQSGVLSQVDQIGVELHTGKTFGNKNLEKKLLKGSLEFIQELTTKWNMFLVSYNPNLCVAKTFDRLKHYYTHHDLLFVKDEK